MAYCHYCCRRSDEPHLEWCPTRPENRPLQTTTEIAASPTAPTFALSVDADGIYPRQPDFFPPIQE